MKNGKKTMAINDKIIEGIDNDKAWKLFVESFKSIEEAEIINQGCGTLLGKYRNCKIGLSTDLFIFIRTYIATIKIDIKKGDKQARAEINIIDLLNDGKSLVNCINKLIDNLEK
jgi:hypothetical protein